MLPWEHFNIPYEGGFAEVDTLMSGVQFTGEPQHAIAQRKASKIFIKVICPCKMVNFDEYKIRIGISW